jgi:hypothetical protein
MHVIKNLNNEIKINFFLPYFFHYGDHARNLRENDDALLVILRDQLEKRIENTLNIGV